jgi:hypothetical protein
MGPWGLARMGPSILMEPQPLPDTRDKDMVARAGPVIAAERVGRAPNLLLLTISRRDEVIL